MAVTVAEATVVVVVVVVLVAVVVVVAVVATARVVHGTLIINILLLLQLYGFCPLVCCNSELTSGNVNLLNIW